VLACRAKEELSARVVGNNRFRERIRVVSITALCFISTTFRPASKSSKDILMQIKKLISPSESIFLSNFLFLLFNIGYFRNQSKKTY
jgi:hypothetical protein